MTDLRERLGKMRGLAEASDPIPSGQIRVAYYDPAIIIALLDGAQRDSVVYKLMRQETRDNVRDTIQRPFLRAIARGEISPDVNINLVADIALPVMLDRAIWNEPIDERFVGFVLDDILMPLVQAPSRST